MEASMSHQSFRSDQPSSSAGAYAGDVTPADAWAALAANPEAVLVDCRTEAELLFVGTPDLAELGKQVVFIEWLNFPQGEVDPGFTDRLKESEISPEVPVYFLCRSGVRSKAAAIAATTDSFEEAYNVSEGFEGPRGPDGRRTVSGWKTAGLPWRQ
jgi:rhodanese-related sulfurtransferase